MVRDAWANQVRSQQDRKEEEQQRRRTYFQMYRVRTYAIIGVAVVALVIGFFVVRGLMGDKEAPDTATDADTVTDTTPVSDSRPPRRPPGKPKVTEEPKFQSMMKELRETFETLQTGLKEAESGKEVAKIFPDIRDLSTQAEYIAQYFDPASYVWDSAAKAELLRIKGQVGDLWLECLSRKKEFAGGPSEVYDKDYEYRTAIELMEAGEWEQTIVCFQHALEGEEYQKNGDLYLRLAICEYHLDREEQAQRHLQEALKYEISEETLLRSSVELRELAATGEVEEVYFAARLESDTRDLGALLWMSVDRLRQGELQEVIEFARRAVEAEPGARKAHRLLALLHCNRDIQGEAWHRHAQRVIELGGDAPFLPLCSVLLASVSSDASGVSLDIVTLKPGVPGSRKLEGKIVEETADSICIAVELSGGSKMKRTIARDDIESIERDIRTGFAKALEEFQKRFCALDLARAGDAVELAKWCARSQDEGLQAAALPLYLLAAEVDPRNRIAEREVARAGFVRDRAGRLVRKLYLQWPRIAEVLGRIADPGEEEEAASFPASLRQALKEWRARSGLAPVAFVDGLACLLDGDSMGARKAFQEAKELDKESRWAHLLDHMFDLAETWEARDKLQEPCTRRNCENGRIRCRECDGAGKIEGTCAKCRGKGHYDKQISGLGTSTESVTCEACRGTGEVTVDCKRCEGEGSRKCTECARRRKALNDLALGRDGGETLRLKPCETCGQQGLIWQEAEEEFRFCPECGGAGCQP